jgi:hypothetical protein
MYGGARTFLETEFPQVINAWTNVINNACEHIVLGDKTKVVATTAESPV